MFARRRVIEEVRARLEAVTSSLSGSRIDVGELREDANELTAVVHSIQWLADVCAPSG
jgi:hypothetical protein